MSKERTGMNEPKEVELPEFDYDDCSKEDAEYGESFAKMVIGKGYNGDIQDAIAVTRSVLHRYKRELRDALTQIAALTAQVEELSADNARLTQESIDEFNSTEDQMGEMKRRYEKAEAELTALTAQVEEYEGHRNHFGGLLKTAEDNNSVLADRLAESLHATITAEAELATLREGETVSYRIDRTMVGGVEQKWEYLSESGARDIYDEVKGWPDNKSLTLSEVITRERILDAGKGEE
jgi:chromosome segregation ATPase